MRLKNSKRSLILASASPRRKELLTNLLKNFPQIDPNFAIVPAHIDESIHPNESPEAYVTRLAYEKARTIAQKMPPEKTRTLILAADTSVVINGDILGKPENNNDARTMLHKLSGHAHTVITGFALMIKTQEDFDIICDFEKTQVFFRDLSEVEILTYIATGEPQDKAGAYAIQGGAVGFVTGLEGSFNNVVGLPTERLHQELTNLLAKHPLSR